MYQQDFLSVHGTLDLEWLETEKNNPVHGIMSKTFKVYK